MNIKNHYDRELAIAHLRHLKDQLQSLLFASRKGCHPDPMSSQQYRRKRTAFDLLVLECKGYFAEVKARHPKAKRNTITIRKYLFNYGYLFNLHRI